MRHTGVALTRDTSPADGRPPLAGWLAGVRLALLWLRRKQRRRTRIQKPPAHRASGSCTTRCGMRWRGVGLCWVCLSNMCARFGPRALGLLFFSAFLLLVAVGGGVAVLVAVVLSRARAGACAGLASGLAWTRAKRCDRSHFHHTVWERETTRLATALDRGCDSHFLCVIANMKHDSKNTRKSSSNVGYHSYRQTFHTAVSHFLVT